MGTRSDIIVHCSDGKWRRVYCHWDGYLSHNGQILFDHYTSQKKNEQLVALGDLSSLRANIGRKHPFESPAPYGTPQQEAYARKYGNMCKAYGRDRGESNVDAQVFSTLFLAWPGNDTGTEFTYVWCSSFEASHPEISAAKWWVGDPDQGTQSLIDLGEALQGKVTITPAVKAFGGPLVIGRHKPYTPTKT